MPLTVLSLLVCVQSLLVCVQTSCSASFLYDYAKCHGDLARPFLAHAASLGQNEAFLILGELALSHENHVEADYWFEAGARLFDPTCLCAWAGSFMSQGNPSRAFPLYKRAADLGNGEGQFNVGVMYRDGLGTRGNRSKARFYLKKAANNMSLGDLRLDAKVLYEGIR